MRLAPLAAFALGLSAAGSLVACQQDPTPPPPSPVVTVSPLIPPLPPAGAETMPVPIVEAQAVFVEGLTAFQTGKPRDAAERFLAVAEVLQKPAGEPFADAFAQNRLLAYRNAAIAFSMGGEVDEARWALEKALERDPQNREGLLELLAMIPPSQASSSALAPGAPPAVPQAAPPAASPASSLAAPPASASAAPPAAPSASTRGAR